MKQVIAPLLDVRGSSGHNFLEQRYTYLDQHNLKNENKVTKLNSIDSNWKIFFVWMTNQTVGTHKLEDNTNVMKLIYVIQKNSAVHLSKLQRPYVPIG